MTKKKALKKELKINIGIYFTNSTKTTRNISFFLFKINGFCLTLKTLHGKKWIFPYKSIITIFMTFPITQFTYHIFFITNCVKAY